MREQLNDARHGVGTVEGTLCAMNDFHLVDVVQGEVGIVEIAAGFVGGCAVDKNLGVVGISAVEEKCRQAADRAGTGDADSWLRIEQVGERNRLALDNLFAR